MPGADRVRADGRRRRVADRLRSSRTLGVYVGIDDFGTGHSSLARLRACPVEVLKVDRSFVDGLGTEPEDSAVVAAILSLAHALGPARDRRGRRDPAAGRTSCSALGCAVAQGFLWSPAVPAARSPALRGARHGRAPARAAATAASAAWSTEMMHQLGIAKEARDDVVAGILALATGLAYTRARRDRRLELIRHRARPRLHPLRRSRSP